MATRGEITRVLLDEHGRTFAAEAGIRLRDTPQPLYQLLVLACLLSARIRSGVAVATARSLSEAGLRDARRMRAASWQERVDALGRGGYRRYDERTATQLGDGAQLLTDTYGGDVRGMRERADGDLGRLRTLLRDVPGLGPTGVNIFLREVQGVWPEVAPLLDVKALQGAAAVGLPDEPRGLARLVGAEELPRFAAALVRVALDRKAAAAVVERANAHG
ncbi:endonuclease [Streptomyces sp. NBC_01387]|uniref:endonuclease n=1 Tax=unclassified Streptomyces TaxID=2593676 RepID=UPI0020251AA8|nr:MULTISPECIES: endonuclease [unclassified Streptomyces]MCX4547313.1 endonuclease [Streptomyces sp. NBC_01500]WSC19040.1 endonuclease [Streptomyces sp. NBC_01766]WSV53063.1 endonuclease [Streptomyces sp. NBC_01014]